MSIIHELAEASRRGRLAIRYQYNAVKFITRGVDWDMPSFDFGDFIYHQPNASPRIGRDQMKSIQDHADELTRRGINLPFPRCAYIFKESCGTPVVEVLEQTDSFIMVTSYFRPASENCQWYFLPKECHFNHHLDNWTSIIHHTSQSEWERQLVPTGLTTAAWSFVQGNKIALATAMLSMPATERETISSDLAASVNRGRAKGKLAPIPDSVAVRLDPVTIRLNPTSSGNSHAGTGLGSPRCPHDRRAHFRRLRSGRVVSVKATSIHGGGDGTRQYRVVA